tara:strand:+ start:182 stop:907 length:726 start_codon:yes stop_codon:yes gene_type:complete
MFGKEKKSEENEALQVDPENVLVKNPEGNESKPDKKDEIIDGNNHEGLEDASKLPPLDLEKESEKAFEPHIHVGNVGTGNDLETEALATQPSLLDLVKSTRLDIDELLQLVKLTFGPKSSISESVFKSKAWLGQFLGQLGDDNPYAVEGEIENKKQIPATDEVSDNVQLLQKFGLENKLEKVLILRSRSQDCIDLIEAIKGFTPEDVKDMRLASIAKTHAYVNISEARFQLGNELAIIRES